METVMTAKELANRCMALATGHKTLYILGCFGAPMNAKNRKRYTQNYSYNAQADRANKILSADEDTFGFDCVCMIKGILWGWNGDAGKTYGGATYASNGVPDTSADGLIAKSAGVSTTGWASMVPGEVLWVPEHIGIYIGNGLCVECTPAWENCVQITAVGNIGPKAGYNTRTWKKHGKLPYVDYAAKATAPANPNRAAVQKRFGFDNSTMAFLDQHPHVDALYLKLATKG
jgi:hypothetical protein